LAWQTDELTAFVHFGIDTFTNKETGDGTAPPTVFNPGALDAGQWMTTLRNGGFRQAMLTAKPDDGFCLWPSRCTTYSVAASSWQGGHGDVVEQFVNAAHEANIRVGLALSPLDYDEPTHGTPAYQAFFECQLTELQVRSRNPPLWPLLSGHFRRDRSIWPFVPLESARE
jgi:alpha-L-fucosidase